MRRSDVLEVLRAHADELCRDFDVASLRLFGSIARDEGCDASDVDLLVGFSLQPSFRQFMRLRIRLEDLLGAPVDLVTETGLKPAVRRYVEEDAIAVA